MLGGGLPVQLGNFCISLFIDEPACIFEKRILLYLEYFYLILLCNRPAFYLTIFRSYLLLMAFKTFI